MHKETWIVVANSTHARIFRLDKKLELIEIKDLVHMESRMHQGDIVEEKPGKRFGARFGSGMYPTASQSNPKKVEAITFAKQVSNHLDNARATGHLERIYLAASPNFLGLLRQEMSNATVHLIAGEIAKDITQLNPKEIRDYFPIGI